MSDTLKRFDDEFPSSWRINIDNASRVVDGELVSGGYWVQVMTTSAVKERHVETMEEALRFALELAGG